MVSQSLITVRYAETDQMGIAHHSVYPIWFEVARTDFIKHAGITYSEMERMGIMLPLTDVSCHYRGVTRYEDTLTIKVRIASLSPARIAFYYEVYKDNEKIPCCTGETHHGWVDATTFRPMNLKRRFPALYDTITRCMEET